MTARRAVFTSLRTGLLLFAAFEGVTGSAEDPIPSAFAAERYASLRASSPFALATVAVVAPVPQASFAANWYVSGIARLGDNDFVTIKSRDLSQQFSLFAGESVDGVTVAGVTWSDEVGKSTVILRRGAETARLEFNEAEVHGPAVAARPAVASQAATSGIAGRMPPLPNAAGGNLRPSAVNVAAMNPTNTAAGFSGGVRLRRRSLPAAVPQ